MTQEPHNPALLLAYRINTAYRFCKSLKEFDDTTELVFLTDLIQTHKFSAMAQSLAKLLPHTFFTDIIPSISTLEDSVSYYNNVLTLIYLLPSSLTVTSQDLVSGRDLVILFDGISSVLVFSITHNLSTMDSSLLSHSTPFFADIAAKILSTSQTHPLDPLPIVPTEDVISLCHSGTSPKSALTSTSHTLATTLNSFTLPSLPPYPTPLPLFTPSSYPSVLAGVNVCLAPAPHNIHVLEETAQSPTPLNHSPSHSTIPMSQEFALAEQLSFSPLPIPHSSSPPPSPKEISPFSSVLKMIEENNHHSPSPNTTQIDDKTPLEVRHLSNSVDLPQHTTIPLSRHSHLVRNVLIIAGISLLALGVVVGFFFLIPKSSSHGTVEMRNTKKSPYSPSLGCCSYNADVPIIRHDKQLYSHLISPNRAMNQFRVHLPSCQFTTSIPLNHR